MVEGWKLELCYLRVRGAAAAPVAVGVPAEDRGSAVGRVLRALQWEQCLLLPEDEQ